MAKVLIVDGEEPIRLLYSKQLASDGHGVALADDRHQLIPQFSTRCFWDIVGAVRPDTR